MKCKTCAHPQCRTIDLALLAENHTLESLSRTFGLSISSLFRHRKHLVARLIRTRQRFRNVQAQGSLLRLSGFLDRVQQGVDTAAADGNVVPVFRGAHVGSRIIHQMNKMEVPLELETVYRLITSPQWASGGSLLPAGPEALAGLQQAVLDDAFFPCPEFHLESAPDLDASAADKETTPPNKRENCAKNPRKSASRATNIMPYQQVNHSEKKLAPNPPCGLENDATPDLACLFIDLFPADTPPADPPLPEGLSPCVGRDPQGGVSQSGAPPAVLTQEGPAPLAANPDTLAALERHLLAQPELAPHLPQLLARLSLFPDDGLEKTPKTKREISAKKARKSRSSKENTILNQSVTSAQKSIAKKRQIVPQAPFTPTSISERLHSRDRPATLQSRRPPPPVGRSGRSPDDCYAL